MRRLVLILLVAFAVLAADARACSCIGPDVARAEGAFIGRVAELSDDRVVFDVEAVVKGSYGARAEFPYFEGNGGNCGGMLRQGQRTGIVVYAQTEVIGLCNQADPAMLDVPAPSPASLLGTLLGTCWSFMAG